jgi:uncharacterized coiled-coil protein SlyX
MLQKLINELTRLQKLEEEVVELENKLGAANRLNAALLRTVHERDDVIVQQRLTIKYFSDKLKEVGYRC